MQNIVNKKDLIGLFSSIFIYRIIGILLNFMTILLLPVFLGNEISIKIISSIFLAQIFSLFFHIGKNFELISSINKIQSKRILSIGILNTFLISTIFYFLLLFVGISPDFIIPLTIVYSLAQLFGDFHRGLGNINLAGIYLYMIGPTTFFGATAVSIIDINLFSSFIFFTIFLLLVFNFLNYKDLKIKELSLIDINISYLLISVLGAIFAQLEFWLFKVLSEDINILDFTISWRVGIIVLIPLSIIQVFVPKVIESFDEKSYFLDWKKYSKVFIAISFISPLIFIIVYFLNYLPELLPDVYDFEKIFIFCIPIFLYAWASLLIGPVEIYYVRVKKNQELINAYLISFIFAFIIIFLINNPLTGLYLIIFVKILAKVYLALK